MARLQSLFTYKFMMPFETQVQFFKTFILPFFDYCSSLFIYMSKTLLNRFNRFFNDCIFKMLRIKVHNLDIEQQANVLNNYNLQPFYFRIIERFAIFSKKIMNDNILNNIKEKLLIRTNIHGLRTFDMYNVPKNVTLDGKRRISIFLPKFLNKIMKNSHNNTFKDLIEHFYTNMNSFYTLFIECIKN